jgi:hypothetical protein
VHGDDAGPPLPGGPVRVLEERPGGFRAVAPGDRIRVDLVGKYGDGEIWGEGPLTFIFGNDTYPGAIHPLRVGSYIRMQHLTTPNDTTVRLLPFPGLDTENEAYQVRRDRGPIVVEHTVRSACRPMKIYFFQTGFGPIEWALGCWVIPRFGGRFAGAAAIDPMAAANHPGAATPDGVVYPPALPRPPADSSRYLGDYGLHLAAAEGRPEVVGWLIGRGRDPLAADSFGFAPIHYAGWAQRPLERFIPALEQSYLDVVDTLLAHGVPVDLRVGKGRPRAFTLPENQHEGQTALGFAAPECADRMVEQLLERGAHPDALDEYSTPALAAAALNGCPETVTMLLAAGADVNLDPTRGGNNPAERLGAVSAFHIGHLECARLLVRAGALTAVAVNRLEARLRDPGPGGFGFGNRPMARRILEVYREGAR